MSKPVLGTKRQCQNCGAKFYDLNRDPITCPKCGTVFQAAAVAPARMSRTPEPKQEQVEPETTGDAEVVSLEEAAEAEGGKEAAADDDVDVGEDADTDDSLLEEEEQDEDDVSGLIDGDIEDDEEA